MILLFHENHNFSGDKIQNSCFYHTLPKMRSVKMIMRQLSHNVALWIKTGLKLMTTNEENSVCK
jgi:hypothetical protein